MKTDLVKIKKQLKNYRDFWGGELLGDIDACKSKEDVKELLDKHEYFLMDQLSDALSHMRNFKRKIGVMP